MRTFLLVVALLVGSWSASSGQVPASVTSTTPAEKSTTVTDKTPTMVMRVKKTTASREVPDTYQGRVLTVGSGGGIVGKETVYALLDDGRLFSRKAGQKSYTFIGNQTAENTKKVFWSVEDRCAIRKTTYNKPGNIYRFVSWKKGRELYRVAWVPGDKALPPNYDQVYAGFMGMIPPTSR